MKLIGWKSGAPENSRQVAVLRELDNGQRIKWICWFCHSGRRWVTRDGVYIGGILGWRDIK